MSSTAAKTIISTIPRIRRVLPKIRKSIDTPSLQPVQHIPFDPHLGPNPNDRPVDVKPGTQNFKLRRPRKGSFFRICFVFEPAFKETVDSLRAKTSAGVTIKSGRMLAPEFTVFSRAPEQKKQECELFLRWICTRYTPFNVTLVPHYIHSTRDYQVGYATSSDHSRHILGSLNQVLWPGQIVKTRTMFIQRKVETKEEADELFKELMETGLLTFKLEGISLNTRTQNEDGTYKLTRKTFKLGSKEEPEIRTSLLLYDGSKLPTEIEDPGSIPNVQHLERVFLDEDGGSYWAA